MDRYHLENPGRLTPDEVSADQKLIQDAGFAHEQVVLQDFRESGVDVAEISGGAFDAAHEATIAAIAAKRPLIYQAALKKGRFRGYADFIEFCSRRGYIVWDTKLAHSPKPHYIIQLCAYSEMIAELTGGMPERCGVILGTHERAEFRLEEFIHFYRRVKANMLALHDAYTSRFEDRPEPLPRADHGRWTSHAEEYFEESDHFVRVAGMTTGQMEKLERAGISTMTELAGAAGRSVPKLAQETLDRLVAQARLQRATLTNRRLNPESPPEYEILPRELPNGRSNGLLLLPEPHPADVFFDMEGYPLVPGGLEYLFGLVTREQPSGSLGFKDWWAHNRDEEKAAFEGFVDYVHARWRANPGMHIYHYAPYELSAVRRLSTRHDTRQDQVDDLLRAGVFVDLYQAVRQGLLLGEDSYSIKRVEQLYRGKRRSDVATAVDSIVQYAAWMSSGEPRQPRVSVILASIRDYNEDDCVSTAELRDWLLQVADEHGLRSGAAVAAPEVEDREPNPEVVARAQTAERLRQKGDAISHTLADVLDYHRREDKPAWWRLFDRAEASDAELRDDPGCIAGVRAVGEPEPVKQSLRQLYEFDPAQECKLAEGGRVMFSHNLAITLELTEFDTANGQLGLKVSTNKLAELGGFPQWGSLLAVEHVIQAPIVRALTEVCERALAGGELPPAVGALLNRRPPAVALRLEGESEVTAARRVTASMATATGSAPDASEAAATGTGAPAGQTGGCFVIQGPPGTGKTYTASRAIADLLAVGKRVGISSNSHKAIVNLMTACGEAGEEQGGAVTGLKVGGKDAEELCARFPDVKYVAGGSAAREQYQGGMVGGTAWLFTRPEWQGELDYLFIDEAGQVPLANAVAMARSARNLVLLGDQMQLEQPVQGTHPGDAGMSVLQYALKDEAASRPDSPAYYSVIPPQKGLFLGTSRRMHPNVCSFISESIYDGRLEAHADCERQRVQVRAGGLVSRGNGLQFSAVEHDGNVQRSDEEVRRVVEIYQELLGQPYTDKAGDKKPLGLSDFLFIAPYNAQVRALAEALPEGARVGSVDKFQGQEAPVCVLSLCSSAGEYGARGLAFILDKNRVNVAISRAQCLAVVVADPRIADTLPASTQEMRLLNLFCKVLQA